MARSPLLSPAHADNDVLILEDVLQGVVAVGAEYGLTHPRRDLLALTLQTLIRSLREGWEDDLCAVLRTTQTGRPSQPASVRRGDPDLPASTPKLSG